MKRFAVILVALSIGALGTASAQDDPIKQRQDLMEKNGDATKLAGQMIKGEKPYDAAAAAEAMKTISGSMDEFVTLFPEGSTSKDSDAKPTIWEDKADFDSLAEKSEEASAKAAEAAADGMDGFRAAFAQVGQSCKACHEKYRIDR